MTRYGTRDARVRVAIRNREPFTTHGALRGVLRDAYGSLPWHGYLPAAYHDRYYGGTTPRDDRATYVVMSYGTPIAWFADGVWHVPAIKYSATSTRHQSVARSAIGAISWDVEIVNG